MKTHTSLQKIADSFLRFESECKLFELSIKGRCFWDYIRVSVFEEIVCEQHAFSESRQKRSYPRLIKLSFRYILFRVRCMLGKVPSCDVLLLNTAYGKYQEDRPVDIYMYPMACALQEKYRVLIYDHYNLDVDSSAYPGHYFQSHHIYFIQKLKSLFINYSTEDRKVFKFISSKIDKIFGVQIDVEQIAKRSFSFQVTYEKFFDKYLKLIKPKVLIYCDNGNVKGVIAAANKRGIETIDFQHGLLTPLDIAYQYPADIPVTLLRPSVPQHIFIFGEFWRTELNVPSNVVPIGFPYIESKLEKYKKKKTAEFEKGIVVISVMLSRKVLSGLAMKLAQLLPDYTIYYKLRNIEFSDWREFYPHDFGRQENIRVIDSSEVSLYQLFSECQYQVSTNSTALYEGAAFGLDTFVLESGRYEEVQALVDNNFASLVTSAEEIVGKIQTGGTSRNEVKATDIFKSNSVENFRYNVSTIIAQAPSAD